MNPLHLLWIIPLSALSGVFCMALCAVNNRRQCRNCVWYEEVVMPHVDPVHNYSPAIFQKQKAGICRRVTTSKEHPVYTRPDGYCHRAERREE